MEVNFCDKVVLVTGASVGIGEAIAIWFAKSGAKVAIVGRNEKNLKNVASKCQQAKGIQPLSIIADLADEGACEKVAKLTLSRFGRLDVLVNNAGIGVFGTIQDTDMKEYDRVFKVNLRAVYDLTRLLTPALIESKGNIVNISSVGGESVHIGNAPYSMTKAALNHFTRLVALELAPKGVRCNAVLPGATMSNFYERMNGTAEVSEEAFKNFISKIPLGEFCKGEDIAKMVLFIASDNARLVTGASLVVDGGLILCGTN